VLVPSQTRLGKHAGELASGGFARWKHVVLHCLRLEHGHSYRETPNRLKYMAEIRNALDPDRDDLPDYSTIYKSFDRLKMWVWWALLRISAQQHLQSGHAALDSTYFHRRSASSSSHQQIHCSNARIVSSIAPSEIVFSDIGLIGDYRPHLHAVDPLAKRPFSDRHPSRADL